jgi:hypothetical protein
LEEIRLTISSNPKEVTKETRKQFWKLVRQIKREVYPKKEEVETATEIRDILFNLDRGRIYPIGTYMAVQTIFGILSFILFYVGLQYPVNWLNIFSWGTDELIAVTLRFIGLFLVVALFYPYGRLIAGRVFGIKSEAVCFDEFKEPTIKIDYETFLLASPPKRKWYFFFSGLWTMITAMLCGMIGWVIAGDILGFTFSTFLIIFYVFVISTGTTKHSRGEMAHYNREKKIEIAWRKRLV